MSEYLRQRAKFYLGVQDERQLVLTEWGSDHKTILLPTLVAGRTDIVLK